jgi:uncharacterized membrane protein
MARQQDDVADYEKELASYLQERIRPGLNRGSIPLLARSIAKEIAHREHPNGAPQDAEEEPSAEADDEASAEAEEEPDVDAEDEPDADEDEYDDEADDDEADDDEAEDEVSAEADDEEADDAQDAESEEPSAFENEMHELQEELGDDWILRFSVQGDDAWLTAEKEDGSQRVEAPIGDVLREAVALLNESGGRST